MKSAISIKALISAAFIGFIFCLSATTTAAQIRPFVDCIEFERNSSGQTTGSYIAYFGYYNYGNFQQTIATTSASNLMSPIRSPLGQPTIFYTGYHPRVFSVRVAISAIQTWALTRFSITATADSALCVADGANALLTTYQGKLSDGAAAANGIYDLRFQMFDAATGGVARTSLMTVEDATVTNGIFTVQLNLGASNLVYPNGYGSSPLAFSQAVNSAIAAGENVFFEIGVRPGNSTGEYTTLTPRQPLTAVPLAARANTATTAVSAGLADFATNATNAINAINATDATNATSATNVFGGIVQLPLTSGAPPANECDASSEYGRQKVDAANIRLYICTAAGWRFTPLQ